MTAWMRQLSFCVVTILFSMMSYASNMAIENASIESIHSGLKKHQFTCEFVIESYLARIKQYNISLNTISFNAFTEVNTNALQEAKRLDLAYKKTKKFKGTLHCIPLIVKDNIDTYDATTTAGSLALLGTKPNQDATLVSAIRQAGGIIIGKASMDELASGMMGISSRSGRIGNAYDPTRIAGGSSGGSAVAVALNFALLGIGTDNSGSVRIPAAFNGIYGLRPSTGLISQSGIFPAGNIDGTAGPMARTVRDLTLLLDVIAKEDPRDKKTSNIPRVSTYTKYLKTNGLLGKRIGILRQVADQDTFKLMPLNVTKLFDAEIKKIQKAGAVIIDNIKLPAFNNDRHYNMSGMKEDIDHYLASFPATRRSLEEICTSKRTRIYGSESECITFINTLIKNEGFDKANHIIMQNKAYVENVMKEASLDALLMPISVMGVTTNNPYNVNTWQRPVSSNAGLPAITINLGYVNGLPFGVELIGKQFREGTLIEIAAGHEFNIAKRKNPVMPDKNLSLAILDTPTYNNLLTLIGYRSYIDILSKKNDDDIIKGLTPIVFQQIIHQVIQAKHD